MWENHLYGSEGGARNDRPYPYPRRQENIAERHPLRGADGAVGSTSAQICSEVLNEPPRLRGQKLLRAI